MARRCQVCAHRYLRRIDQALLRGDSFVAVARQFSISKYSVRRHHSHIKTALSVAQQQREQDEKYGSSLLDELAAIARDTERLQTDAENRADMRSALMGISQRLKSLELKAKLTGAMPEPRASLTVNLNQLNIPKERLLEIAQTFVERHALLSVTANAKSRDAESAPGVCEAEVQQNG